MHYRQSPHVVNRELMTLLPKVSIRQEAQRIVQDEILLSTTKSKSSSRSNQNSKLYWVSVHRRKLEGQCKKRIHKNLTSCTYLMEYAKSIDLLFNDPLAHVHYKHRASHPVLDAKFICDIQYDNVTNDIAYQQLVARQRDEQGEKQQSSSSSPSSSSLSVPIILFTDHQKPTYDDTFIPNIDTHPFTVQLYMMTLSTLHYGNPSSSVDHVVAHWRLGNNMIPSNCWKSSHFV